MPRKVDRDKIHGRILTVLGSECKSCGNKDARVLQVDHVNRATEPRGHHHRSGPGLWLQILKGHKPLSDFQLLCCNCNFIKKLENKEMYPLHKSVI